MKIKNLLIFLALAATNLYAQDCVVSGCNNELCTTKGACEFSTCFWKAEYECYQKYGICEANAQGNCEWRPTKKLLNCVKLRDEQVEDVDRYSD